MLDPSSYGTVNITRSINIVNDDSGGAGVLTAGTNGIIVNAGANDVVTPRGLVIDGGTPTLPGLNGLRFNSGASLHVCAT